MSRRTCAAAALLTCAVLGPAGCGGGDDAQRRSAAGDAFKEVSREPALTRTARRAAPRWERVTVVRGDAPATQGLTIAPGAIQWRARWRCSAGELKLSVEPEPRSAPDRAGGRCPERGETTWVQTGKQSLRIDARGSWTVIVEQQVDTPIREPPLAAMRAPGARVLARGRFYGVERQGSGDALLYRLPNGRTALRLQNFRTSSNTDLFVWLSAAKRPKTTKATVRARRIGPLTELKATIGEQNYVLPKSVDPDRIGSIVIWCVPIQIVYSAAALQRS